MMKIFKIKLIIGIVLAIFAVIPLYNGNYSAGSFILTMGLVLIISNLIYIKRGDANYKKDERTKKIAAYAAFYSWLITILGVSVIYLMTKLQFVTLALEEFLSFLILFMVVSLYIFYYYFSSKGDIQ
ncbi:MAG: hypothetical protein V3575_03960 [Candidatus Absconditabacteria bacterium]